MKSWWCVDIESADGQHSKTKDHKTLEEIIEWLNDYGKCDEDYFIICAVEVFYKRKNGKDVYEDVVKTQALRTMVN